MVTHSPAVIKRNKSQWAQAKLWTQIREHLRQELGSVKDARIGEVSFKNLPSKWDLSEFGQATVQNAGKEGTGYGFHIHIPDRLYACVYAKDSASNLIPGFYVFGLLQIFGNENSILLQRKVCYKYADTTEGVIGLIIADMEKREGIKYGVISSGRHTELIGRRMIESRAILPLHILKITDGKATIIKNPELDKANIDLLIFDDCEHLNPETIEPALADMSTNRVKRWSTQNRRHAISELIKTATCSGNGITVSDICGELEIENESALEHLSNLATSGFVISNGDTFFWTRKIALADLLLKSPSVVISDAASNILQAKLSALVCKLDKIDRDRDSKIRNRQAILEDRLERKRSRLRDLDIKRLVRQGYRIANSEEARIQKVVRWEENRLRKEEFARCLAEKRLRKHLEREEKRKIKIAAIDALQEEHRQNIKDSADTRAQNRKIRKSEIEISKIVASLDVSDSVLITMAQSTGYKVSLSQLSTIFKKSTDAFFASISNLKNNNFIRMDTPETVTLTQKGLDYLETILQQRTLVKFLKSLRKDWC